MLLSLLAAALVCQDPAEPPPRVLPEGTAAERTAAALHGGIAARKVAMGSCATVAGWKSWAADLEGERKASAPEAERRARLALFALEQERWAEAWEHFARTSGDPALSAGLLPRFLPGIGADATIDKDGFAAVLPDGVELHPALPPAKGDAPPGRIERREMRLAKLRVGGATISLRVAMELDGVVIEAAHVAGEACHVAFVLPRDPQFVFANEYIDWYVQETHGAPLKLELKPGEDAHTLYGRLELRNISAPTRLPPKLPALVAREGLVLALDPGDPEQALLDSIAQSFAAPPLSVNAHVWVRGSKELPHGLVIDLTRPEERKLRLADLCTSIEGFVFALPR